jgi:hypothetical protein
LARFVSVTFGIALSLFGVLFVVVYLLANVRKIKAAYLMAAPKRYRQDASELLDDFAFSLSRRPRGAQGPLRLLPRPALHRKLACEPQDHKKGDGEGRKRDGTPSM